eukprot:GHVT01067865.1.p1 GENE.GHVT01067865.1~~GHVT01067865.1.p1  ORF type:complete len:677 (+),score=171.04 GHVT01067865.1:2861-4891(+)
MASSEPPAGGLPPVMASVGSRVLEVKNKMPAPVQITAEMLLREAVERQAEDIKPPLQRVVDEEELQQYRVRKRKEFEDILRRQRQHIGTWIKYATWEAAQKEFRRARSVFERALHVEYQNTTLWLKYIEMEMKNRFISSARNVYDRACQLLPRVDQFWYKYAHMEELLGNYVGARAVFERWMEWTPDDKGWMMFVRFEERCGEVQRAQKVFERYLSQKPTPEAFLRFAKFETRHRNFDRARAGFEKAIEVLPSDMLDENFYLKFAQFEQTQREKDRAEAIFRLALQRLPKGKSDELYRQFVAFQKQFGDRDAIESVVLDKRRFVYEEELQANPQHYDIWFDYTRLEEAAGDVQKTREVYERAVAQIPPIQEKKYWKRYIYLWLNYALYEELMTGDMVRARSIYEKATSLVPHSRFSFSKLFILFAEFELRQLNLGRARRIFGSGIALCGKGRVFDTYAALELRLGNIDNCRRIYAKSIESHPFLPRGWVNLIDLELLADEVDRARAICELAVSMDAMEEPELVWKAYIDLETSRGEGDRVRNLYARLLEKTQHFRVFKALADFELDQGGGVVEARKVVAKAAKIYKDQGADEPRAVLLDYLVAVEKKFGTQADLQKAFEMLPKKVKRSRELVDDMGMPAGQEEYVAYLFPEEFKHQNNLKILQAAKAWKKKKQANN